MKECYKKISEHIDLIPEQMPQTALDVSVCVRYRTMDCSIICTVTIYYLK